MQEWNEMSKHEQLSAEHYDFYKEVRGIRPRWIDYETLSEAELEQMLMDLGDEFEENEARENAEYDRIAVLVEERIADLINIGAKTREVAVNWLHEAYDTNGDSEYLCYLMGVRYGYFGK